MDGAGTGNKNLTPSGIHRASLLHPFALVSAHASCPGAHGDTGVCKSICPGKLTAGTPKMEVWKMMFPFNLGIVWFHVRFSGL